MQTEHTMRRLVSLCMLVVGSCCAGASGELSERLKAELRKGYLYAPPKPIEDRVDAADDSILQLKPIVVRGPDLRTEDFLFEMQRAAEIEQAKKFSPIKGGLLSSKNLGSGELDLGIWPRLVQTTETPVKKGEVMLKVDVVRVKW